MNRLVPLFLAGVVCSAPVLAESVSILFVGNSYTFGRVDPLTGIDPWSFGANEKAAADLGISPGDAVKLQRVASDQLYAAGVPLVRAPCLHASPGARGAAQGAKSASSCGGGAR